MHKTFTGLTVKAADKGEVSAVFSTFGVIDHDGDITLPGAIKDGTEVVISSYGHESHWGALPVGKGGQGGPLILSSPPLAADELQREIDRVAERIQERSDSLTALESQLMERRIKSPLLPTIVPIDAERIGSTFGRRVDPIAGVGAMH